MTAAHKMTATRAEKAGRVTTCRCCEIARELSANASERIVAFGTGWVLNRHVDAARPALVLQTRRHVGHLGELTRIEADGLAQLLPVIDSVLRELSGAERIHVVLLAESAPHVHWHFIPRYDDDPAGVAGMALLASPPSVPEPERIVERVRRAVETKTRLGGRPVEPSPIVRWLVRLLDAVQRRTPYDPLLRRWRGPIARDPHPPRFPSLIEWLLRRIGQPLGARASADAATVYVATLLALLTAICVLVSLWPRWWLVPFLGVLAAYRVVDVATFQLRSLLDRRASILASFERTLMFLGINLAEMVLALGIMLVAWDRRSPGAAFRDAFGIVTRLAS